MWLLFFIVHLDSTALVCVSGSKTAAGGGSAAGGQDDVSGQLVRGKRDEHADGDFAGSRCIEFFEEIVHVSSPSVEDVFRSDGRSRSVRLRPVFIL